MVFVEKLAQCSVLLGGASQVREALHDRGHILGSQCGGRVELADGGQNGVPAFLGLLQRDRRTERGQGDFRQGELFGQEPGRDRRPSRILQHDA